MNCKSFQERLYDYLDGNLSAASRAAAEKHAAQCNPCREAVRRERQLAQFLSLRLEEITEPVVVDLELPSRIRLALERKPAAVSGNVGFVQRWFVSLCQLPLAPQPLPLSDSC